MVAMEEKIADVENSLSFATNIMFRWGVTRLERKGRVR